MLPDSVARKFDKYRTVELAESLRPKTVDGQVQIIGLVQVDTCINGILVPDTLWCSANTEKVLISRKVCRLTGLIPEGFPNVNCKKAYANTVTNELPLAADGFDVLPDHSVKKVINLTFPKAKNLEQLAQKFPEVFDGHIGRVAGPPAHIELRQDAVPTSAGAHRRVAEAYMKPLKDEIDEQIQAGILEKVD